VIRTLSLRNIVLGETYSKNDIYLMNTFDLERKNEEVFNIYDLRYCSIGSHLKLSKLSNIQKLLPRILSSQCVIFSWIFTSEVASLIPKFKDKRIS